jgi:hypothetical protein
MKLNELEARLPALYYSALEDGGPSYYVTSAPGRGKTSVFKTFKRSMKRIDPEGKYGFAYINGANFTLMTAMGFMVWADDAKGRAVSKFSLPYWYYDADDHVTLDEYNGGLLFIDEADKLGMDEKKIVGEVALSKILGNHRLPPGWVAMFAGNRLSDRSGSTKELDHLINRRIEIAVQDDVESWKEWALGGNLMAETIQFGEENPQLLFEPKPEDQRPWCTPRSLHQIDIHLRSLMASFGTNKIPTDPLTQEEVKGGIGAPACAQFMKTIRLGQDLHSYEEVVANPQRTSVPTRPDAQRLMSYKLASRVVPSDAAVVLEYMQRLPEEHQVMFVRMAIQRNYQLAFQPDFAAFCGRKTALIAILNRYKTADK